MRVSSSISSPTTTPQLIENAKELHSWLARKSITELMKIMKVSEKLAILTKQKIDAWTDDNETAIPAIDCFIGDIYSGLQASGLDAGDRDFAQKHLRILSGLYGVLRPLDGIMPYRFEMGYKTPGLEQKNVYEFWGTSIADTLPDETTFINVSSDEYTKAVLPFVENSTVITPRFLTYDKQKNEPVFVVVHAKIARGAFAGWMIRNRITQSSKLHGFNEMGYSYNKTMSTEHEPVFVCEEFGGIGLSVRLS